MTISRVERTLAFVDLAGFTALTEAHGDEEAVATLMRFRELTEAALAPTDVLVKTIGDAVMLAFCDPEHAVIALRRIFSATLTDPSLPLIQQLLDAASERQFPTIGQLLDAARQRGEPGRACRATGIGGGPQVRRDVQRCRHRRTVRRAERSSGRATDAPMRVERRARSVQATGVRQGGSSWGVARFDGVRPSR